jgi:hypothetical protein
LQVLEAREGLTSYARTRYDIAATNAQQGLVEHAQELQNDDYIVKKSGWNRQFNSHDKTQKRLMTKTEAAKRDANHREQAMAQEARLQDINAYPPQGPKPIPSSVPPASTEVRMVPNTPPQRALIEKEEERLKEESAEEAEEESVEKEKRLEEEEMKEGGNEEEDEETFILPSSTAPAILLRGGRKRASIMKALEAEMASKRGTRQSRAGRGRGRSGGRGSRGGRQILRW